jgi:diacylglycerol kinase family enzyme
VASTGAEPDGDRLAERLGGVAALLVVGGDGAVRAACGPAIRSRTPIYHVPCGTANLFARELGMSRRRRTLLQTLQRFGTRRVDAGLANGHTFALMVSIGFDAEVVHDLARHRGASISYVSYLGPMLRQLRRWRPPELAVTVDGRPLETSGTGAVIVANCRQYMWGLNPARQAAMTDGKLDVVYFPIRSTRQLLGWIGRCRLGRQLRDPRLVRCLATSVEIECAEPQRVQLDGDPPPDGTGAATRRLEVTVQPQALPVLVPPRSDR